MLQNIQLNLVLQVYLCLTKREVEVHCARAIICAFKNAQFGAMVNPEVSQSKSKDINETSSKLSTIIYNDNSQKTHTVVGKKKPKSISTNKKQVKCCLCKLMVGKYSCEKRNYCQKYLMKLAGIS